MSSAGNPLSGHTAANYASSLGVDGLKDGDQILSASLTNLYEGIHGNGILLIEDTAIGETDRNNADNLPGAITTHSDAEKITIKGGEVILDGVVYGFAGGYNSSTKAPETFTISLTKNSDNIKPSHTASELNTGEECIFTIYLSGEDDSSVKHVYFEQGSKVTTAANAYSTSSSSYLTTPHTTTVTNHQTVVIATIRAIHNSSASGDNTGTHGLTLTITEINDKRVFVKPTPIYLTPVTSGASNSVAAVNNIDTALDNLHSGQVGNFNASNLGAIWMSYDASGNNVLYFSGKQDGSRRTFKLGPDNIYMDSNWVTGDGNISFKFDADNVFLLTPNNASLQLNPIGTFPPGHLVHVFNDGGSESMTFNATNTAGGGSGATAISQAIATATSMVFCFDGTNWKKIMTSSAGGAGTIANYTNSTDNRVLTSVDSNTINAEANLLFSGSLLEVGSAAGSGIDAKLYTAGTAAHVGLHWDANGATEGTLYGGVDDHGVDLKFFGEATGKFIHWDMSADTFYVSGTLDSDGPITVGADDTGYDVKFFGATASAYMLWDESQDDLILGGTATLGIGETAPGTALQVSTSEPYVTLKNTTAENTDGGAESKVIFEDHANVTLAQIQGSHDGTADDTKGDLIFSTHSGSSLVEALRIDSTKLATFAGDVTVTGDLTINGATSSISVETLYVDQPLIEVGLTNGAAPSADAQKDLGLKMHWHTGSTAKIAALVLDEDTSASAPVLTYIPDATDTSGVMSGVVGSMVANLVGSQSGGSVAASTITGSDDLAIDTDTLFVDVSTDTVGINQATPLAPLQIASSGFGQVDAAANTAAQNVILFNKTQFRGAKVTISTTNVTDTSYETAEMVLTHDGSAAFITVYGVVSSTGVAQVTYSADINNNDVRVVLTPLGSDNCSYKIAWKALAV